MDCGSFPVTESALTRALATRLHDCAEFAGGADNRNDVQLVLVVGSLDIAEITQLLRSVCHDTSPNILREWAANFTKCVLLAGNPHKVVPRFSAQRWTVGKSVAIVGPTASKDASGLRRLLRPLQASPPQEQLFCVSPALEPGIAPGLELRIARRGLSLEQYLVALVHSIAEPQLHGRLSRSSQLHVQPVDDLDTIDENAVYLRVHKDLPPREGLRLYSMLRTKEPS